MTIDCGKAGATTRRQVEAVARRITEANGFPPWKLIDVAKTAEYPNLALIIARTPIQ